jgi:hypothetical protein
MLNQTIRTADQQVNSVRLNGSSQGLPVAIGWGRNRVPGNLIWYGAFTATAQRTSQGGKGGPAAENTTYSYTAAIVFALGFGQIVGVTNVYKDKAKFSAAALGFSVFTGTGGQSAWGYLTTNFPAQALRYKDIAYVAAGPYALDSSGAITSHSFEVNWRNAFGGPNAVVDANPRDIIIDFLTNTTYGALFPSASLDALTAFGNYCAAAGIFYSPLVAEQEEAHATVEKWVEAANSRCFWSEGRLKITPYGDKSLTANGVTYTPVTDVRFALTKAFFLEPVRIMRKTPADVFNVVTVEFLNRATDYNKDVVEAKDDASIAQIGERRAPVLTAHFICDAGVARNVAQLQLQRHQFVRNQYEVRLPFVFFELEPMDIVTLTDASVGLNAVPVTILEVEMADDYTITMLCEDRPAEAGTVGAVYGTATSGGYSADTSAAPGNATAPVIFQPPVAFTGQPEVFIATSGGTEWGGCEVWVSYDNVTYAQAATIGGKSRHGTLTSTFASGSDPDTVNTLAVSLAVSGGTLATVSTTDVDAFVNPSWVGGEIVCSRTATLTGPNAYNLTYHRRGLYGTGIASRASGSAYVRLDEYVARVPFAVADVGKTLYVKLVSFNRFGQARQDISALSPTTYTILAPAQPAAPTGVTATATVAGVVVKSDKSTAADFTGMVVHASTTSGFTPGPGNLVYEGVDVVTPPIVLAPSVQYIRVAHTNRFGSGALNFAAEISVTPTRSVQVVTTLPGSGNVDDCVLLTTNMTLYRWNGSAWV